MSETTTSESAVFERLAQLAGQADAAALLAAAEEELRARGSYHELFEVKKMQVRQSLGLPLLYNDAGDDLDEKQREKLEDGLIAACRDIGLALLGGRPHSRGLDLPAASRR